MARELRGLTQRGLASLLRYTPLTISRWERGERKPTIGDLSRLAELLGVDLNWLIKGEGEIEPKTPDAWPPPGAIPVVPVPVYGSVPAGWPESLEPTDKPISYIFLPKNIVTPGSIALIVQGASMEPTIHDGEIVLIQPSKISPPQNGDIVVAALYGGEYSIKELRKVNNKILLLPHNPAYKTIEIHDPNTPELKIVGRVTKIISIRDPKK